MDGIVTSTQNRPIFCNTCLKCGNGCDSKPDSIVNECLDYEEKLSSIVMSDQRGYICRSCAKKEMRPLCEPDSGYECSRWIVDPALMKDQEENEDKVNHPSHYTQGGIECLDAIEAAMKPDQFRGYLKGNIIKYLWRYEWKNGLEDLKKAQFYMNRMVDSMVKEIEEELADG